MLAILIIGLMAGPAVSSGRVPDRVASDRRRVRLRALATVEGRPRSASSRRPRPRLPDVIAIAQEEAGDDRPHQQPKKHSALMIPHDDREEDGDQRRQHHEP